MTRRAVITGAGAVSPFGPGAPALLEGILAGRSVVAAAGPGGAGCAPVSDPLDAGPFPENAWRRLDRASRMAALAAREALTAARLPAATGPHAAAPHAASGPHAAAGPPAETARVAIGIVLGTMTAGTVPLSGYLRALHAEGPEAASPMLFPFTVPNAAASQCSILLGLRGPNVTLCRMEASGLAAIATAAGLIRSGAADVLLAGGVDEIVRELHDVWLAIGAAARRGPGAPGGPAAGGGPFDAGGAGFFPGEGAYLVVVESEESARLRGVPIWAGIAGDASAHHPGAPHRWPDPLAGSAAWSAAARALERAGAAPAEVGYVAAAANGSPVLDGAESRLLAAVLGDAAGRVPITSVKGAIGECGAASAAGALLAAAAIRDGFVPPTALLRDPRAGGLEIVGRAVKVPISRVLAHALGSGGSEVGVVFAAP